MEEIIMRTSKPSKYMRLHRCQALVNGDPVQVTLVVPFVLLLELGLQARFETTRLNFCLCM
jgi:hypothetical protein